jgi:flagellar motility protein MotE (MotC chaperone)
VTSHPARQEIRSLRVVLALACVSAGLAVPARASDWVTEVVTEAARYDAWLAPSTRPAPARAPQRKRAQVATPAPAEQPEYTAVEFIETGAVPAAQPEPTPPAAGSELVTRYCAAIRQPAAEAQLARQQQELAKARDEIDGRLALLDAKMAETRQWLAKRKEFTDRAHEQLVRLYAQMRPEPAAAQLTAMNEVVAAAILSKLGPKAGSPILAEMEPAQAARLSAIIAGSADLGAESRTASEPKT